MFVVKTTSATLGPTAPERLPRKRAPSSRRRNPGRRFGPLTGRYGCGGLAADVGDLFAGVPVGCALPGDGAAVFCVASAPPCAGALPAGAGGLLAAGSSGTAGAVLVGGALVVAGCENDSSRTDRCVAARVERIESAKPSKRKMPAHHQLR